MMKLVKFELIFLFYQPQRTQRGHFDEIAVFVINDGGNPYHHC